MIRIALGVCVVAGCSFPEPSADLACETTDDCEAGRVCDDGFCVVGDPDPVADAATNDAVDDRCLGWTAAHFDPCAIVEPQGALNLDQDGTYTFDTDTGVLTGPDATQTTPPSQMIPSGRLISVDSFSVGAGATVRLSGALPVVVASFSTIDIQGQISAASNTTAIGPGADPPDCTAHAATAGGDEILGGGGGGGGGFGGPGGGGGTGNGLAGAGGTAVAVPPLVIGGCAGGAGGAGDDPGGGGGAGGGALQLTARDSIAVAGVISAGGGGGRPGQCAGGNCNNRGGGGGGGGSGGYVGLDSVSVTVGAGAILAANGGGGGGGSHDEMGQPGGDGTPGSIAAGGGNRGGTDGGDGGDGSAGANLAGSTGESDESAGGGGGGAGFVLLISVSASVDGAAVVSPPATVQTP